MGSHLAHSRTGKASTPRPWLAVGKSVGDFVNSRAQREDVVAFLGDTAGMGIAPAAFILPLAEIDLNREQVFGDHVKPQHVGDFTQRQTLFDWPVAAGALIHEASHARWSPEALVKSLNELKFDRRDATKRKVGTVVELMEESRIEGLAIKTWPDDRAFLRSCALKLVVGEHDTKDAKDGNKFALSTLMLLTSARIDAGVLDADDIEELTAGFETVFGADLIAQLRELWVAAQAVTKNEFAQLKPLAERWVELLDEFAPEEKDSDGQSGGAGAPIPQALQDLLDQLGELAEDVEISAGDEAADQESVERAQARAQAENADARERHEAEETATQVFGKGTTDLVANTASRVREKRPPTGPERAAAVIVARELEKAKYRNREETTVHSALPPGRLKTRTAIQGAAERQQGRPATQAPWARTQRKSTDEPKLTIGVMTDISGSMSAAMVPMAVTSYVLSEAGRRVQARCAQVYYGNDVFPTLKPGQHLTEVVVRSAPDGTERFDRAFKALDGALELTRGTGARLLVICSDLYYTHTEVEALKKWVKRCVSHGVGVLVIPFDDGETVERHGLPAAVKVIKNATDPTKIAREIGHAAAQALTTAGGQA